MYLYVYYFNYWTVSRHLKYVCTKPQMNYFVLEFRIGGKFSHMLEQTKKKAVRHNT